MVLCFGRVVQREWAFQLIAHEDRDFDDKDYGFGVYRDFGDRLNIGFLLEDDVDTSERDYALVARYELSDDIVFRGVLSRNDPSGGGAAETGAEFAFIKYFGTQPNAASRYHRKEFNKWHTDFEQRDPMPNSGNGRLFSGGFLGGSIERVQASSDDPFMILEGDIMLGYQRDDFIVGLGMQLSHHSQFSGSESVQDDEIGYFFLGLGNITATIALGGGSDLWEASSMFPQNLIGFQDQGRARDELFRLDWRINDYHHLAFSHDMDRDQHWALGYQGRIMGNGSIPEFIITAGAEWDDAGLDEYGVIFTVPYQEWAFQGIFTFDDLDDTINREWGIGVHRDFGDRLTLGALWQTSNSTTGNEDSYGVVGRYALRDDLIFHLEAFKEYSSGTPFRNYKFGFLHYFGDKQPNLDKRSHLKEGYKWLTDF